MVARPSRGPGAAGLATGDMLEITLPGRDKILATRQADDVFYAGVVRGYKLTLRRI